MSPYGEDTHAHGAHKTSKTGGMKWLCGTSGRDRWQEVAEQWAQQLNTANQRARTQQSYTLARVKPRWQVRCTGKLAAGVSLAVLACTAEAGMPHTQPGGIICLPLPLPPPSKLCTTLLHELVHVWQRQEHAYWDTVLQNAWKAAPCLTVHVPAHARMNPDTFYAGMYAYASRVVPLVLLSGKGSDLQNIHLRLVDATGSHDASKEDQKAILMYFGYTGVDAAPPAWMEHPYETAAYIITEWVSTGRLSSAAAVDLIDVITPGVILEQLGTIDVDEATDLGMP